MRGPLLLLSPLLLAACVAGTAPDAPSLQPRPIESRGDVEPAIVAPAPAPDPAFDARVAERSAAFDAAARAFDAARPSIAQKIARARGAAEGSDRWLDGQSAVGELQQARTASDGAMADLEALAIDRGAAGRAPDPALDAAIARAQAELNRQAGIETALKAALGA